MVGVHQNLNVSSELTTLLSRIILPSMGKHLLRSTYLPNLKYLSLPTTKIRKAIQNSENGGGFRVHSRSLEVAPFDRAYRSSYPLFT